MRDGTLVAAALLLGAGLAIMVPSTAEAAAARLRLSVGKEPLAHRQGIPTGSLVRTLASALPAVAVALLLSRPLGFAAAAGVFTLSRAVLKRLGARSARPAPIELSPFAIELVAACLDAGASPASSLAAAGAEISPPLGEALRGAAEAMADGAATHEALPEAGPLAPLAAVFRRSAQSGSRMSDQLVEVAGQLRADEHFERLAKAQRVGVLSALPLGLCMLPAFLLLAVIPAVIGLGTGLLR